MKKETLKQIASEIQTIDREILKQIASEITNIEKVKAIMKLFSNKSDDLIEETILLLNRINKCDYKHFDVYKIFANENVLENRTIDDIVRLIYIVDLCNLIPQSVLYTIAVNKDVLENRNIEEHLKLMRKVLNSESLYMWTSLIAVDKTMLEKHTFEDQLQWMTTFETKAKKHPYYNIEQLYKLFMNKDALENRTLEEHLLLIDKAIDLNNIYANKIATNKDVLETRNIEEHLLLMDTLNREKSRLKFSGNRSQYEIAVNRDILEKTNIKEQVKMMQKVKKSHK